MICLRWQFNLNALVLKFLSTSLLKSLALEVLEQSDFFIKSFFILT